MVGADDVHEQAIARLIEIVDRAMEQRVVEYEQRLLVPEVSLVVDIDENLIAVDRIKIVENAECQAQRTEMPGGLCAGVEDRYRDGLDVAIFLLEGGNLYRDVLLLGVPLKRQHAAFLIAKYVGNVGFDEVAIVDECLNAGFDFGPVFH